MAEIYLKRIYEPFEESDGTRILVDRVWPRGMTKENARLDCWLKEIAPSSELRKWFGHKPERFPEFRSKYLDELKTDKRKIQSMELLHKIAKEGKVTLLYGAKDSLHNQAVILLEELSRKLAEEK